MINPQTLPTKIILASKSSIRQQLLRQAGINFTVKIAELDEEHWQKDEKLTAATIAQALAKEKSRLVSLGEKEAYVIGADQTLGLGNQLFNKPTSRTAAKQQLIALRGKTHELYSALSCHYQGREIWSCCEQASLTMRDFSDEFLETYIEEQGDTLLTSVGAYKLEEAGIQLFQNITGDYFTILGLPLLPLLDFFRQEKLIPS